MIGFMELSCDVHDLDSIPVELPIGTVTMATKRGSSYLNPRLKLNHVLFVPGLNCSLISIVQLIDENFCDVTLLKRCV